jgi:adenosylhomocysteinase
MILDDGGDATLLVHLGAKAETDLRASSVRRARKRPRSSMRFARGWRRIQVLFADQVGIRGVTEETTTGVKRSIRCTLKDASAFRRSTSTIR